MQTGFLVGRFVFTPTQKVASKTFKETNHTRTPDHTDLFTMA